MAAGSHRLPAQPRPRDGALPLGAELCPRGAAVALPAPLPFLPQPRALRARPPPGAVLPPAAMLPAAALLLRRCAAAAGLRAAFRGPAGERRRAGRGVLAVTRRAGLGLGVSSLSLRCTLMWCCVPLRDPSCARPREPSQAV